MKDIDWSKAPEGATHFHPGNDKYTPHWYKEGCFCVIGHEDKPWVKDGYSASTTDMTPRPVTPRWKGTGLPPVETVCEVNHDGGWYETTIVGYDPEDGAVIFKTHERCEVPYDGYTTPDRFRPIRTPEQIAAEERIAAINYMEIDAGMCSTAFDGDPEARVWVENLIDKGWRKTVGGAE